MAYYLYKRHVPVQKYYAVNLSYGYCMVNTFGAIFFESALKVIVPLQGVGKGVGGGTKSLPKSFGLAKAGNSSRLYRALCRANIDLNNCLKSLYRFQTII